MKKIILGLALIGWLTACSSDSYKLSGKLDDVKTGSVHLKKIGPMGLVDVDTAPLTDGAFTFEGKIEHPELFLLFYENNRTPVAFFLENAKITITGSSENLEDAVVKGSKLSTIFEKFNKEVPHQEKVERMREEFFIAQSTGDETAMESIMADMQVIVEDQQKYYREFVKSNNTNVVGAFLALNMAQALEFEELEELAASFEKSLKNHPYVEQLKEILEPMKAQMAIEAALALGNEAPGFTLLDLNGNEVSLDAFRGKYVFVDFWAGWCRPCRMENPILKKAYERFGGENFEIISVSLDRTEEEWRKAVAEDALTWTNLHDPMGMTAETYAVQSIPNTWLLDKDGKIINKQLRGEQLIEVLESLLN
ncbi:TlpA disulfide reductase family protein [Alkaliflexus imshenetskii]|uniref:TlpA disulfide reductase family protein n=1 Tax=Alkaliflexus imshenetskii TaxID=286730 RepID=UPI00047BEF40|nr:TlpA disulfide reductase family protein [Alkaliflexus imshenetskii]